MSEASQLMARFAGLVVGVEPLARLGIELDQPDVAEIGAVGQPQPAVGGIQKDARIDGIAVLDAVGRGDHAALFPLVVGGIRVEGLAPYHVDGGFGLRPDVRGDIHVVAVADVNDVGGHPARAGVPPRRQVQPSSETKEEPPVP